MNKIFALAGVTLVTVGLTGGAHAGPNCKAGAASADAPKTSAAKQAQSPAKASVQRVAQAPLTAQGGGDGETSAPVAAKKLVLAAPKIVSPAVAVPEQITPAVPANGDGAGEYTSVSGIAARLAALAAQQKANAKTAD